MSEPEYATMISCCPASIFLMASAVQCNKPFGHKGNHSVTIEWIVR